MWREKKRKKHRTNVKEIENKQTIKYQCESIKIGEKQFVLIKKKGKIKKYVYIDVRSFINTHFPLTHRNFRIYFSAEVKHKLKAHVVKIKSTKTTTTTEKKRFESN